MTEFSLRQRPWSDEYDGLPRIRTCYGCPDRNDDKCLDPRCWNDKKSGCERMMECRVELARLEAEGVEVTERSMHDLREGAYRDLDAIAEASMQGWAAPFTVLVED